MLLWLALQPPADPAGWLEALRTIGVSPLGALLGILLLAIVGLGSGIGMWLGLRWGWWLAAFYYVHAILRSLSALGNLAAMADEFEGRLDLEYHYWKHGGRIAVYTLILIYFFRPGVLAYFGVDGRSKGRMLAKLITAAVVISVAILLAP